MTGWMKKTAAAVILLAAVGMAAIPAGAAWVENPQSETYSYTENGVAVTDCWKYIDGNWYRFDENGAAVTGWYTEDGAVYYLKPDGSMARNWTEIDGQWYCFTSSGNPRSGWFYSCGEWYCLEQNGRMMTDRLIEEDGGTYYLTESGIMARGLTEVRGDTYYFGGDGKARSGWVKTEGNWYYFGGDGRMLTSQWIDETYYLTPSGQMAQGFYKVDGVQHYFLGNGAMSRSWVLDEDIWYYFGPDGEMRTGWIVYQDQRYFANDKGETQTGLIQIGGINYSFDEDGALIGSGVSGTAAAAYDTNGKKVILATGETVKLTMYANYNIFKFGQLLEEYNVCTQEAFLAACNTVQTFKYNDQIPDNVFYRYEGYLYPGSYSFYTGQDANSVVEMMLMNFEENVDEELIQQFNERGYTLHEAITLASILQSEGGSSSYRYAISAVFQNRLQSADYPKMQSNPTRTYASTYIEPVNPELAAAYDTYQCKGIPAGPINNPGETAIDALLNPDPNCDGFYFCSDGKGNVYFASTLEEHYANCRLAGIEGY